MTSMRSSRFRGVLALAVLLVALALPTRAPAATTVGGQDCTPTQAQNAPPPNGRQCEPTRAGGGGGGGGALPFTGLDVISLLAIAVALTGSGLALRRLTHGGAGGGRPLRSTTGRP
jgi:hypothetical protein